MSHTSLRLEHRFSSSGHQVYSDKHIGASTSPVIQKKLNWEIQNVKTKVRAIDKGGPAYLVLGSKSTASRKELWVLETWKAPW